MKISITRKFLKDLAVVPAPYRKKIEAFVFIEVSKLNSYHKIAGLQKLQGYEEYYKIRFGDYRVGVKIEEDELIFERVLHRKEIYRYFP